MIDYASKIKATELLKNSYEQLEPDNDNKYTIRYIKSAIGCKTLGFDSWESEDDGTMYMFYSEDIDESTPPNFVATFLARACKLITDEERIFGDVVVIPESILMIGN